MKPCDTPHALYSKPFAFRTVWAAGVASWARLQPDRTIPQILAQLQRIVSGPRGWGRLSLRTLFMARRPGAGAPTPSAARSSLPRPLEAGLTFRWRRLLLLQPLLLLLGSALLLLVSAPLLLGIGALLPVFPLRDGGRTFAKERVLLRRREEACRDVAALDLPCPDHFARARTKCAVDGSDVEAQR